MKSSFAYVKLVEKKIPETVCLKTILRNFSKKVNLHAIFLARGEEDEGRVRSTKCWQRTTLTYLLYTPNFIYFAFFLMLDYSSIYLFYSEAVYLYPPRKFACRKQKTPHTWADHGDSAIPARHAAEAKQSLSSPHTCADPENSAIPGQPAAEAKQALSTPHTEGRGLPSKKIGGIILFT